MLQEFTLTVLIYQEDKFWIAQCLEFDVAAQGYNLDEVRRRFMETLSMEMRYYHDSSNYNFLNEKQAPVSFFERSLTSVEVPPILPVYNNSNSNLKLKVRFLRECKNESKNLE